MRKWTESWGRKEGGVGLGGRLTLVDITLLYEYGSPDLSTV